MLNAKSLFIFVMVSLIMLWLCSCNCNLPVISKNNDVMWFGNDGLGLTISE